MKNEQQTCQICKKNFAKSKLFPASLIRNSILEIAKEIFPNFDQEGFLCMEDLRKLRAARIEKILIENKGELTKLDEDVIQSLEEHKLITENVNKKFEKSLTFGEKVSDKLSYFAGSWKFIFLYTIIIFAWIGINLYPLLHKPFDPFPFILLNLFLSCLAALQAPVILMAQNRQYQKDKLLVDDEYRTNLKSELEIRQIHSKLDQFMKNQWDRLLELQQIQIDITEDLLAKKKTK